jgi:pyruvate/2-oxoglutarate/acetoin dehydrogenase E1 component
MTTYLESLNQGLRAAMRADERIHLLGEDVLDPYGGAFKVEKGLSSEFPDRVHTTPISEAGFTGLATGMALRGLRPIVSIMFGDFMALTFDQVLNHMVKFATMYGRPLDVPVVIRTPMGGRRGYGATHSQSIEKYFCGVPGLDVYAPSHLHDPGAILAGIATRARSPSLFIENKSLYALPLHTATDAAFVARSDGHGTIVVRNFRDGPPDATIVGYGGMAAIVLPLLEDFAHEEIRLSFVIPAKIAPLDLRLIAEEVRLTGLVLVVEEGTAGFSWGSEVAASIAERCLRELKSPVRRLASKSRIIPCSREGEEDVLLGRKDVESALLELLA